MNARSERLKAALRDVQKAREKLDTALVRFEETDFNEVRMQVVEE